MRNLPLKRYAACLLAGLILSFMSETAAAEVVAVVSAKSPVTTLSKNQLVNIFLGNTSRFPDGSMAVPIDQAEGSDVRNEFYNKFANKSPAQIKSHWAKIIFTGRGQPPKQVENGAEAIKRVIENPNAIGYIDEKLVNDKLKVIAIR